MALENNSTLEKKAILERLYSFQRFGIKPGLERTLELLESIGNPHLKLKSIHVAGTNGKGSVTSSLASILFSSGYKVGLYTSPHIFDFNERIRINGQMISDDDIIRLFNLLLDKSIEIGATFFEITTLMAFLYFKEQNVDLVILETGMGGRFDSTNVVTPLLSIITKIDLDHQEYLGNTIEEITNEKAGIIKPNIPIILNNNNQSVIDIIKSKALELNSEFYYSDELINLELIKYHKDLFAEYNVVFSSDNSKIENIKYLAGNHQQDNLKSIITAINLLNNQFDISEKAIRIGLEKVKERFGLKYRLEHIEIIRNNQNINLYADVSHNPNSIQSAINTLKTCKLDNLNILFSVMEDKDINLMLDYLIDYILQTPNQKLILTQIKYQRAIKVDKLYEIAKEIFLAKTKNFSSKIDISTKIQIIEDANKAFEDLVNLNISQNQEFICLGSFYLFEELEDKLKN